MKKIIQSLLIIILILAISLIVIFMFNPLGTRDTLIGSIINSYLEKNIEGYSSIDEKENSDINLLNTEEIKKTDGGHPLLNDNQEEMLENIGVDVNKLPTEITSGMEECFVEKLGKARTDEIAKGETPSAIEFFKAKDCIGK